MFVYTRHRAKDSDQPFELLFSKPFTVHPACRICSHLFLDRSVIGERKKSICRFCDLRKNTTAWECEIRGNIATFHFFTKGVRQLILYTSWYLFYCRRARRRHSKDLTNFFLLENLTLSHLTKNNKENILEDFERMIFTGWFASI